MPFTGNEGAPIPLNQAIQLTSAYRSNNPGKVKAHFFGTNIINQLLNLPNAVGIRIYHGQDPVTGEHKLVLAAADAYEKDILTMVADFSIPCPHNCDSMSPLNTASEGGGGPVVS